MPNASWLDEFAVAVNNLYSAIETLAQSDPTPEEAVSALAELHGLKANFTLAWEAMNRVAANSMGTIPEIVLPDGTKIEKRNSADRKAWQHAELATQVARKIQDLSVDMDTGERTMTTEQMITALLDYVAPSYWRVKALNGIGVNPDKYCEVTEGKPSIIVRKAQTS